MLSFFSLSDMQPGQTATVHSLISNENIRRRFQDLGIIPGKKIQCLFKSPFGDPTAFLIKGAVIALRKEDTKNIIMY